MGQQITDENFAKVLNGKKDPVILVFRATWCAPSLSIDQTLAMVEQQYGSDRVLIIDIDECPNMAKHFKLKGTPSSIIVSMGDPVASRIGAMELEEMIEWAQDFMCPKH